MDLKKVGAHKLSPNNGSEKSCLTEPLLNIGSEKCCLLSSLAGRAFTVALSIFKIY